METPCYAPKPRVHGALEAPVSAARRSADLLDEACMSSQFRAPPAVTLLTIRAANGRAGDPLRTLRAWRRRAAEAPVGGCYLRMKACAARRNSADSSCARKARSSSSIRAGMLAVSLRSRLLVA